MARYDGALDLTGRILLALIFVLAGVNKIGSYEATQGYMEMFRVPGILLIPTILLEVLGGLALAIGFQTRTAALLLAGFTLLSALIFHTNFADQAQMTNFLKNLAIVGGLLIVVRTGAGALSIDHRRATRSTTVAA